MCFGPLRRLCHWGPYITLFLVFYITGMAILCDLFYWPPHTGSIFSIVHFGVLSSWIFFILYNYFHAVFYGPGFVPLGWKPEKPEDEKYLQYCHVCKGYKAPRSHHCKYCKRCVMKMDHHCPWINTCCGHRNHAHFTYFLIFAPLGCFHGAVVISLTIYTEIFKQLYSPKQYRKPSNTPLGLEYGLPQLLMSFIAVGLALGVALAVSFLFFTQIRSILKNESGIENWIVAKAQYRHRNLEEEFVYPYNLGRKRNLQQVFTWQGQPQGDGITWPVIDGCTQYTLTMEQIMQKQLKKERMIEYIATEDYEGSWFPISKGCRTCICIPLTDESRIEIDEGDIIMVSRWKKYWLYGEVIQDDDEDPAPRIRGWFPRQCAKQNTGQVDSDGESKKVN
ncbi:palmitoyltransferase ZDHHC6-like [Acanthaster planci]|uniref:Palmitoyltransferase n=1 Tax=Acanthaster planci TaxID=133434 RepID=A0A8B7YNP8_ACAPL|nr:palmitoyltransferase ZDHHC6-like [Acanthaster planci]XP_022094985.1 palmitoyltransferase ZDHHC6-like [Acanthaster planci]